MEKNIIHADVSRRVISLSDYVPPTRGNVSHDFVEIGLDDEWDGLDKRVTFCGGGKDVTVEWDGSSEIEIPWECIEGSIGLTVVGSEDGTDRLVTKEMPHTRRIIVRDNGHDEGVEPSEPTMDVVIRLDKLTEKLEGESERIAEIADSLESAEGSRQDAFDASQAKRGDEFAASQASRAADYAESKAKWQSDVSDAVASAGKATAKANASANAADDAAYTADASAKGARIAADYASKATTSAKEAAESAKQMAALAERGYESAMNAAGSARWSADYALEMGNTAYKFGVDAKVVADDIAQRAQAGEFNGRPFRIDFIASSVESLPKTASEGQFAVIQSDVEQEDNAKLFVWRSNEKLIDNQQMSPDKYGEYRSEHVPAVDGATYRAIVHDGVGTDSYGYQREVTGYLLALNGHPKGADEDYVVPGEVQIGGFGDANIDGSDVYAEYTVDFSRLPFDSWDELYFVVKFNVQKNVTVIKKGAGWAYLTDMSGASGIEGPRGIQGPPGPAGSDAPATDVRINGTSITGDDGVADIPLAVEGTSATGVFGVMKPYSVPFYTQNGRLFLNEASNTYINSRQAQAPITGLNLDYAVKASLTDGKGTAWTDAEKLAARERIGLGGNFELIEEINVTEAVQTITRAATPSGKAYNFARVVVEVETGISTGTAPLYVKMNNLSYATAILWNVITTAKKYCVAYLEVLNGRGLAVSLNAGSAGSAAPPSVSPCSFLHESAPSISKLTMTASAAVPIPVGTVIKIYGVWA